VLVPLGELEVADTTTVCQTEIVAEAILPLFISWNRLIEVLNLMFSQQPQYRGDILVHLDIHSLEDSGMHLRKHHIKPPKFPREKLSSKRSVRQPKNFESEFLRNHEAWWFR